ncbi:MAG: bifunctional oligoribonuclease/PAP phosphatase NrnA [Actinomycetota bacterium]|nr:bifunctional oligoribonuclease/PAP phosphatase NrnA [Actinomycetota bacterium]
MSAATALDQVVEELHTADRLLLTTHENPDGDALGSLLAAREIMAALGKDAIMFMAADEFPLPHEYRWLPLHDVVNAPPADVGERLVVFLDCGNIERMPVDFLRREGVRILNIDHHHDNTRFGTVNLVDPDASCTAEILWRLARELGVELTPRIAEALYVGLITDTGRFMYENTTPDAHRMAAELVEAGIDVHDVYRRLYEGLPECRIELLARALGRIERHDGGTLTLTHLTRADFAETGAAETDTEGIVDHLRALQGTAVAGLARELVAADRVGLRKVSLRAVDGRVDVSRIARSFGGGGHRQAAGFSTELALPELVERLRAEVGGQL